MCAVQDVIQSEIGKAYAQFLEEPNNANFAVLLDHARCSDILKFKIIYNYSIVCDELAPVSRLEEHVIAKSKDFLRENSAHVPEALTVVLANHKSRWRRWTAAKVISKCCGTEALPLLKKQLELEKDEIVKRYIEEAITCIKKK